MTPAPKHLTAASRRVWKQVTTDYSLEERHLATLRLALEALDRADQARDRIAADGPYLRDRYGGLKPHPALNVERDARIMYARLTRELGLDLTDPPTSRPPSRWH